MRDFWVKRTQNGRFLLLEMNAPFQQCMWWCWAVSPVCVRSLLLQSFGITAQSIRRFMSLKGATWNSSGAHCFLQDRARHLQPAWVAWLTGFSVGATRGAPADLRRVCSSSRSHGRVFALLACNPPSIGRLPFPISPSRTGLLQLNTHRALLMRWLPSNWASLKSGPGPYLACTAEFDCGPADWAPGSSEPVSVPASKRSSREEEGRKAWRRVLLRKLLRLRQVSMSTFIQNERSRATAPHPPLPHVLEPLPDGACNHRKRRI